MQQMIRLTVFLSSATTISQIALKINNRLMLQLILYIFLVICQYIASVI
jgi:hypothetical protein